jgi:hypothetical protein
MFERVVSIKNKYDQQLLITSFQYDMYYTPSSSQSTTNTDAHTPSSDVQYGRSWMLASVKKRQELDRAQLSPRAELQGYIEGPLEITDDVVGWWGVSFSIQS